LLFGRDTRCAEAVDVPHKLTATSTVSTAVFRKKYLHDGFQDHDLPARFAARAAEIRPAAVDVIAQQDRIPIKMTAHLLGRKNQAGRSRSEIQNSPTAHFSMKSSSSIRVSHFIR
jgi:hypothetical protein